MVKRIYGTSISIFVGNVLSFDYRIIWQTNIQEYCIWCNEKISEYRIFTGKKSLKKIKIGRIPGDL